jgi:hypothetical protein
MSRFIQALESRTLFAATPVTKAALLADRAALLAQAKSARADLVALGASLNADTKLVQTDLKGSAAGNALLLRMLRADEGKTRGTVNKDLNSLLGPTLGLANRSIGHAIALIAHSSTAIDARVAADLAALATVLAAPLAKLDADLHAPAIGVDLQAISAANSTNATLGTDISKLEGDTSAASTTLTGAVTSFQDGVETVSSDVAAAPPGPSGPGGSRIPNLVGTYLGQVTDGTHNQGLPSNWTLHITTEGAGGSFSGTITTTQNGNTTSQTESVTGSVTASGSFTATASDPTTGQAGGSLTGTISGTTLSGTFNDGMGGTGPFSLAKQ